METSYCRNCGGQLERMQAGHINAGEWTHLRANNESGKISFCVNAGKPSEQWGVGPTRIEPIDELSQLILDTFPMDAIPSEDPASPTQPA